MAFLRLPEDWPSKNLEQQALSLIPQATLNLTLTRWAGVRFGLWKKRKRLLPL